MLENNQFQQLIISIFRLRCGSLSSSSNMHHHDHTWHRTAEAGGENSSTATASDLQQHLDQGLLSSSSSRSRQRSSPGSNSLSFPVSPYFNFRAYFPSSSSICRYVSQKPWQERLGIGQSQSDLSTMIGKTILCVSSSTLLPLLHCHFQSYFLKTPQKMTLAVVTKYLLISRGQKHESLSSKSAFSTFLNALNVPQRLM